MHWVGNWVWSSVGRKERKMAGLRALPKVEHWASCLAACWACQMVASTAIGWAGRMAVWRVKLTVDCWDLNSAGCSEGLRAGCWEMYWAEHWAAWKDLWWVGKWDVNWVDSWARSLVGRRARKMADSRALPTVEHWASC